MTLDFVTLKSRQNALQYAKQISSICSRPYHDGEIRTMSSAKNKQEMTNPIILDPYPHLVNKRIRSLTYNEKKSGDSIPPCFVPVVMSNTFP